MGIFEKLFNINLHKYKNGVGQRVFMEYYYHLLNNR